MKLNEKGQCCGRKPIHYKGGSPISPPDAPMFFCDRCCRAYDVKTGVQKDNWAYSKYKGFWWRNGQIVEQIVETEL